MRFGCFKVTWLNEQRRPQIKHLRQILENNKTSTFYIYKYIHKYTCIYRNIYKYIEIYNIHRSSGRQTKIWMDNVMEDLKQENIDLNRIGEAIRNREVCRRSLIRASSSAR